MTRRPRTRAWLLGPMAIAAAALFGPIGSTAAAPIPGEAGVNTGLPLTPSQAVVQGRGRFASMTFTINQTSELINQAISISWTGGDPTRAPGQLGENYVQVFQCWGDPIADVASNPGPAPEQCVQGARTAQQGFNNDPFPNFYSPTRILTRPGNPNSEELQASGIGKIDPVSGNVYRPFRAVNGTTIDIPVDATCFPNIVGCNFWLNTFFNIVTTNEIAGAKTRQNGTGSELFQVNTGLEAPGLGCGQKVQPVAESTRKVPQCWLVIVPRGLAADENVGMAEDGGQFGVITSPLTPNAWQNRIAVPLEFRPLESPCNLADTERRLVGSELAQAAVTSWQPALCTSGDLPPYSFAPVGDAVARQQLASPVAGGPGMVLVSGPLTGVSIDPTSPVVYAPVAVSGLVIGFNLQRKPAIDAPPEQILLSGTNIVQLNMTPRLIAKMLTQSYRSQIDIQAIVAPYPWATKNPQGMLLDPDFLRFNPEFALMSLDRRTTGGFVLPSGNFDGAAQLWEYVLSDPEARTFLDGTADEWEMRVNPVYSTNPSVNPLGFAFGDPLPNSFPKADPTCYQAPPIGRINPSPLCGTDWMPYTRNLVEGALFTRNGNDVARINLNTLAQSSNEVWRRDPPQPSGLQSLITVTDVASASRFGLQTARLSRSGDDGDSRTFIAPDDVGLIAGVVAMKPKTELQVLEPDPLAVAPDAYPLTSLVYAATKPLSLDAQARQEYAAFIDYAATAGQTSGFEIGQLPPGYVSLPDVLRLQAVVNAEAVRRLQPAPTVPADETAPVAAVPIAPAPTVQAPSVPAAAAPADAAPASPSGSNPSPGLPSASQPTSNNTGSRPPSGSSSGGVSAPVDTVVPSTEVPTSEPPPSTEVPVTTIVAVAATPPALVAPPPPLTPGVDLSLSRFIFVLLGVVAIAAALVALEITKRARRAPAEASSAFIEQPGDAPTELILSKQTIDA